MCGQLGVRKIVDCNVTVTSTQRRILVNREKKRVCNVTRIFRFTWDICDISVESDYSGLDRVPKSRYGVFRVIDRFPAYSCFPKDETWQRFCHLIPISMTILKFRSQQLRLATSCDVVESCSLLPYPFGKRSILITHLLPDNLWNRFWIIQVFDYDRRLV